ncbi:putative 3-isopropylmalate dehydratase-like [Capsicum annuum]|nr:putative 3-isopropylmalate dehydratase-like [Capsicum annuum]
MDDGFWEEIGLGDLIDGHHAKIGRSVAFPGHVLGLGLTLNAAKAYGARMWYFHNPHATWLYPGQNYSWSLGTFLVSALLDHIIENHVASPHLANRAASRRISIFDLLNEILETMKQDEGSPFIAALTNDIHILPDFHDPFHEVKSKREKRKETKDTTESRSWITSSTPSRGSRASEERYVGRGGSDRRPTAVSDAAGNDGKRLAKAAVDGHSAASKPSSGYQPTWGGVPGQVSMADIVKMGMPQSKVSSIPNTSHRTVGINQNHDQAPPPYGASHHNMQFSDDHLKVPEVHHKPRDYSSQNLSANAEWPSIEQPSAASQPSVSEPPTNSMLHPDPSNASFDRIDNQTQMDESEEADDRANEDLGSCLSGRKLPKDNGDSASLVLASSSHPYVVSIYEAVNASVSSVAANLQQLNVKDYRGLPSDGGVVHPLCSRTIFKFKQLTVDT